MPGPVLPPLEVSDEHAAELAAMFESVRQPVDMRMSPLIALANECDRFKLTGHGRPHSCFMCQVLG